MDNKPLGADSDSNAPYNEKEPEVRGSCAICRAAVNMGDYCVLVYSLHLVCADCAEEIHDLYEQLP